MSLNRDQHLTFDRVTLIDAYETRITALEAELTAATAAVDDTRDATVDALYEALLGLRFDTGALYGALHQDPMRRNEFMSSPSPTGKVGLGIEVDAVTVRAHLDAYDGVREKTRALEHYRRERAVLLACSDEQLTLQVSEVAALLGAS